MRSLLSLLALVLAGCAAGTPAPFRSGLYEAPAEEIWLDLRVEDDEVVFYDGAGASVDADGHVQGDELHRAGMDSLTQEERGELCGDGLWYEAAMIDDYVTFELNGIWFSWPTLVQDCDGEHLILSDDPMAEACDGDEVCVRFAPMD